MPGLDRTGPTGAGPLTGGGFGRCGGLEGGAARGGRGRRNRFRAMGRWGWRRAGVAAAVGQVTSAPSPNPEAEEQEQHHEQELQRLQSQVAAATATLEGMRRRLDELTKAKKEQAAAE